MNKVFLHNTLVSFALKFLFGLFFSCTETCFPLQVCALWGMERQTNCRLTTLFFFFLLPSLLGIKSEIQQFIILCPWLLASFYPGCTPLPIILNPSMHTSITRESYYVMLLPLSLREREASFRPPFSELEPRGLSLIHDRPRSSLPPSHHFFDKLPPPRLSSPF